MADVADIVDARCWSGRGSHSEDEVIALQRGHGAQGENRSGDWGVSEEAAVVVVCGEERLHDGEHEAVEILREV